MSKWIGTALVIASMFAVIGCNGADQQEQEGGPGAQQTQDQQPEDQQPEDQQPEDQQEATFTASLEKETLEVPAGQEKEMSLSIERGEQFEQTVLVKVTPPEGLSADPGELEFQSGQQEGKITLKAESGAPVGEEQAVEIRFEPETGEAITKQLKVMVVESKEGDDSSN